MSIHLGSPRRQCDGASFISCGSEKNRLLSSSGVGVSAAGDDAAGDDAAGDAVAVDVFCLLASGIRGLKLTSGSCFGSAFSAASASGFRGLVLVSGCGCEASPDFLASQASRLRLSRRRVEGDFLFFFSVDSVGFAGRSLLPVDQTISRWILPLVDSRVNTGSLFSLSPLNRLQSVCPRPARMV